MRDKRSKSKAAQTKAPLTVVYGEAKPGKKRKFSAEHCRNISLGKRGKPYKSSASGKFGKMFKNGLAKVRHFVDHQENNSNSATRKLHKAVRKPIVNHPKVRRAWLKSVHRPIQGIARKLRRD